MNSNMLNLEEQQHKDEIVSLTEQVLDANGIECDSKISKISEEQLRVILEQVRKLRKKKKIEEDNERQVQEEIFLYKNIKMSRNSPSATPLWPLIYGLGIVAFRFGFWRQVGRKTLYSIGMVIMNKRELVSRITITKMMMVLI